MKEIEADFLAIYSKEYESCDGPQFIRLASRLLYYDGCLVKKIQMTEDPKSNQDQDDGTYDGPMELSMREVVARKNKDEMAMLDALNRDSESSPFGPLFERTVVSG